MAKLVTVFLRRAAKGVDASTLGTGSKKLIHEEPTTMTLREAKKLRKLFAGVSEVDIEICDSLLCVFNARDTIHEFGYIFTGTAPEGYDTI